MRHLGRQSLRRSSDVKCRFCSVRRHEECEYIADDKARCGCECVRALAVRSEGALSPQEVAEEKLASQVRDALATEQGRRDFFSRWHRMSTTQQNYLVTVLLKFRSTRDRIAKDVRSHSAVRPARRLRS